MNQACDGCFSSSSLSAGEREEQDNDGALQEAADAIQLQPPRTGLRLQKRQDMHDAFTNAGKNRGVVFQIIYVF